MVRRHLTERGPSRGWAGALFAVLSFVSTSDASAAPAISRSRTGIDFATLSEAKHLVPFHHDPGHTDADLDHLMEEAMAAAKPACRVTPGLEGATFEI